MKWFNHYYNQLLELNFKTWVVSILMIWLPISNLAVQYVVNVRSGPTLISNIKDLLIVGLIINLSIEIYLMIRARVEYPGKSLPQKAIELIRPCLPLLIVLLLNILAISSSFIFNRVGIKIFVIGYYFELFWLDLLAIWLTWNSLRMSHKPQTGSLELGLIPAKALLIKGFDWSVIIRSVWIGFVLVAIVSLASIGFGQVKVLSNFGYGLSDTGGLVSSNNPCHKLDYGIDTCRLMGSFGHPLHFVSYLLMVLGVLLSQIVLVKDFRLRAFYAVLVVLNLIFIYLSHTRFAIFGLVLSLLWLVFGWGGSYLNREYLFFGRVIRLMIAKFAMLFALVVILITTVFVLNIDINTYFPAVASQLPKSLTKPSSSAWHIRQTSSNLQVIKDSPSKLLTGFGLGTAGSTARSKYQNLETNPIYQKLIAQGKFYPDMIQNYIIIPDNWLIQTSLNGGLLYTLLYLVLLLWPLSYIWQLIKLEAWDNLSVARGFLICALLGILVGNLVQQLFESQVTVFFFVVVCGLLNTKVKADKSIPVIN